MGKLVYNKIPVVRVESGDADASKPEYCDLPVIRKYRSALADRYTLKEDVRGKMLGNLYIDRVIAVSGAFGIVVRGYDVLDSKYYAVKIIRPQEKGDKYAEDLASEIAAFNLLSRYPDCEKNIVCLYNEGVNKKSKKLPKKVLTAFRENPVTNDKKLQRVTGEYSYLQMKLMSADLRDFIDGMAKYQGEEWGKKYPDVVRKIILSVMDGLGVIHRAGFAHMDLKPGNILVKFEGGMEVCDFYKNPNVDNLTVKVGDLGFLCSGKRRAGLIQECWARASPNYASPEVMEVWLEPEYPLGSAQKADVWSVGIILGELMFPKKYIKPITRANAEFWRNVDDEDELVDFDDARAEFLEEYEAFLSQLPEYRSGNKEFDEDISTIFRRMIHLNPNKRDNIRDLIVMFPPM